MDTLITNAEWLSMERFELVNGSLVIDEGKIKHLFPEGELPDALEVEEVIDGSGYLIIPGMTNGHYHSYSNLLKGTESDLPLEMWSLYTVAYGHSLTDQDIQDAVLLGAAEMIRNGVTGCIDHFPHLPRVEAALHAYEKSGLHAAFAPMLHDIPDHQFLQLELPSSILKRLETKKPPSISEMEAFFERLIAEWHGKNDQIQIMLGPNAPQRCSAESLALCARLSRKHDLNIQTHLLETNIQKTFGDSTYDQGLIGHLDRAGVLNDKLSVAHAIWLSEQEIELLQARGVSVVHNPASNMTLGSGTSPIPKFLEKGIPVGLGTDASNCGTSHNLFEAMRLATLLQRKESNQYTDWLKAETALAMAITSGAEIMGGTSKRGKISQGYDADLVFLKKQNSTWTPVHDPARQLVFHENGSSVDSVMIKGRWVLRHKEILTFDEQTLFERVGGRSNEMIANCADALAFADELKPYFGQVFK
ncbi:amidohydrolase family protein [Thalassobacillus pellis]|uniref:amidohydrolase family protein n=1 Tax=Thalassobacillus pellis TaxID=748008 RepID=UPI00195F5B32|nr:amidohydrolase family protein [Thalassobacillus pellis]MBM7552083.1 5-methylthioadenosine/S-adenosylhomocysteine deaminase [Thalassobacillus pellis]